MTSADRARHAADAAWRDITRSRTRLHGFSVTSLYGCPRQLHYRANRTVPSDDIAPGLKIDAHLGTAIHDLYLPYFAKAWKDSEPDDIITCQAEPELVLKRNGLKLTGHPDVVAWRRDRTAQVWDAKTHEKTKFDAVAAGDILATEKSWWQVWVYARIIELADRYRVTECLIYHLDRSDPLAYRDYQRSARRFTDAIDYTDEHRAIADALIDDGFAAATGAENAARRWFGTEQSKVDSLYSPCKQCPWQTRCLGKPVECEDAEAHAAPGVAAEVLRGWQEARQLKSETSGAVKEHIRLHRQAKAAGKAEGRLKELIADLALEPGTVYVADDGQRYRLYESGASEMDDTKAMKKILTERGIAIPRAPKARGLEIEVLPPQ